MQFFKQLTDPALKRLYKFVLKRLIGRFLAEDEIDLDQLDVHLRSGRLELCDLLLNADVLNAEICEANGLPFRVKKGYLGSVRVTISYMNIMSESCLVEIDDIEIVLVPVGEEEAPKEVSKPRGKVSGEAKHETKVTQQASSESKSHETSTEYTDEVSQEGLDFVASWIEQVTSKIKVTLSNICLRLETCDKVNEKNVALLCKLEWAQFTDESASEVASVYGRGGMDQSFGSSSQSMYQSMAASSLFGISQKAVKFRGISMDLLLPSDELEDDDPGSVLHHFLASDSSRQCYVQLKLSHYEALEAPTVDADLFLHSIRVVLQPQHFYHFGTLMEAFGDEPPPKPKERYTTPASMYASVCESKPAWLEQDDQDEANEGGVKLSFREFQRIEQLLLHYHKTHEELVNAQRDRNHSNGGSYEHADFPYPVPRRLSSAESVESVGLSDLEEEEDFFECDPGSESMAGSANFGRASNMMAQSMYASALYELDETKSVVTDATNTSRSLRSSLRQRPSRSVRNRIKVHLLECDIVILYDDLLDLEDEEDCVDYSSETRRQRQLRRRRRGLPVITDQERIEVIIKDVILSTLIYKSYTTVALSVGTFEIVEKMTARMSTDIDGDEDALLTNSVLRFTDISPATKRKVNLSANLSAQIRIDMNTENGVESLAAQISAQPILLEWDMYIIDRAHRLMKLMEESSTAKQKKIANSIQVPQTMYPKKLDVNTECFEITLRFPMVNSDLIRFGPSSRRGLSEDKLVLTLEGVKACSYADGAEAESILPQSMKSKLPWLSQFDVRFDSIDVSLISPRGGNQRSSDFLTYAVLGGRNDMTSGDSCSLRLRLQVPSNDEIRAALTAKHNISQDSLEQFIEFAANTNTSDSEEKSGDDNDGGRVGPNGWSQDARTRAHDFEVTASTAALMDLEIKIPHAKGVFSKQSFDRLMILFDALLMINPIDVNGHNQMMVTAAYRNRLIPSYMTIEVELNDGTIELEYSPPPTVADKQPQVSFVYHVAFQDFRIFQVSQWMGQLVSRVHIAAQNITLLEEDKDTKVTSPVLYKNPIGVNEAPVLFVGIDIIDQTQEMREMKVELHVSQVNMRYDVSSKWMIYLSELLLLEYPVPIISLDSASTTEEEYNELLLQIEARAFDTVKLAVPPKTVFTKLFVSLYDAVVDYSPTTLSSRVMLVLGNVTVSSNVVTGALIQGYKISVRDVQLYLTPDRPTYEEIDDSILGNELLSSTNKSKKHAIVSFAGESRSRGQLSALYPSQLMFFEKHGFLQMVTVDFIDVFLRAIVPPVEDSTLSLPSERKVSPSSLGAPELSVELNLGTANIYACFDSFNTLIELISTWTEQLSVEGEPRDTTAYVGLDRVKDVSSVSVVTNLGPATVRSSRPSVDESLSQTPPLSSSRLASQNALISDHTSNASQFSRAHKSTSGTSSTGINLFAQLDENAFGSDRRVFPGNHATTDTEARLLRTRLHEIQKEKERMVSSALEVRDDALSAAELRRKYNKQEEEPARPRMRINELFIEDYYSGEGVKNGESDLSDGAGDFLMAPADKKAPVTYPGDENPWFSSRTTEQTPVHNESQPVGSLPDEHSARWLGPSAFDDSAAASSPYSSPRFDPVEEDPFAQETKPPSPPQYDIDNDRDAYDEDDEFPSGAFPAGPKNWWGMQPPTDVELSELQTEETESFFSHHIPFMDDESTQDDDHQHPLSMSMMIGNGEDEGTEVELDFTLDREMQTKFDRLMEVNSSDGKELEDLEEVDEEEDSSTGVPTEHPTMNILGSRRYSKPDISAPISIPPRTSSFSEQSSHSGAASAIPSLFSPPDEPTARWFYDDLTGDSAQREGPPSRIYPHHVEIPIGGTAASLSFGERECDEAIRSVAREGTATKNPVSPPVVIRHVLLRDFNICMRFFGGSDWSKDLVNVPTLARRDISNRSVTPETRSEGLAVVSMDRKEKLLDALLDNYVPSTENGLFGADSSENSVFSASSRPRSSDRTATDRSTSSSSTASRKRSLKSGRKTEEMLELVVTRIQMRLDVFNEEDTQPLASNTVLALGDIEILDYISTSQIRKIICYWKSDASHPRESGSSMVHVHLMTVRPGPNLCEEHRLKVRLLPLRVNLDQEVVNFLRQFVPAEIGGRGPSTVPGATIADDEEEKEGLEGTELSMMKSSIPSKVTETDVSLGMWFFQSIDIRPCKIKIDYRPNRVDFEALRAGDYLEVINLFVLEGMELVLRRVKASGIDGWAALGEHVLMSWVNDISRHQIHKCVASVSMPPLRPFANIGSGAADLILLPLEHYGRDRRLVRGIKKGAKSFLKSVTIETLNTASKVAEGTQAILQHADDVVSSTSSRKRQIKYRQPGSRIARNSKTLGGGGIRSAQDRGGIGNRQYLTQQPSNATEGLYQAYDSLSRELHVAAKTIVAVPLIEYKKTGSQGYVRSVIRAVPVAVLRPMIGASEAVSKALIGVRNAMDPEMKEDVENKFKDFRTI